MTFDELERVYARGDLKQLLDDPDGTYYLKLRSMNRAECMRQMANAAGIDISGIPARSLLKRIFEERPAEAVIDATSRAIYEVGRQERRNREQALVSELYKMQVFDWGGFYQNAVEQKIVNNYVKKIADFDLLNRLIDNEVLTSLRGYVQCSWYNHWTSIIIEDIFKDHPRVLPTVGLARQVDFFIDGIPFDLKVTPFPDGYMEKRRNAKGWLPELTQLRQFADELGIPFDRRQAARPMFRELTARIREHVAPEAKEFVGLLTHQRAEIVQETTERPEDLIVWLYENQGTRRFDASNRLFLVLADMSYLEESWKLKRNHELLAGEIGDYLEGRDFSDKASFCFDFLWEKDKYTVCADALFVLANG